MYNYLYQCPVCSWRGTSELMKYEDSMYYCPHCLCELGDEFDPTNSLNQDNFTYRGENE